MMGLQTSATPCGTFNVGAEDPNSGLHTCAGNTLPYEPFLGFDFSLILGTGSHHIAQVGYKLVILLSWPPRLLGLQVCATMPAGKVTFDTSF